MKKKKPILSDRVLIWMIVHSDFNLVIHFLECSVTHYCLPLTSWNGKGGQDEQLLLDRVPGTVSHTTLWIHSTCTAHDSTWLYSNSSYQEMPSWASFQCGKRKWDVGEIKIFFFWSFFKLERGLSEILWTWYAIVLMHQGCRVQKEMVCLKLWHQNVFPLRILQNKCFGDLEKGTAWEERAFKFYFSFLFSVLRGIRTQHTVTLTSAEPLLDSSLSWLEHSKMPRRVFVPLKNEPASLWRHFLKYHYFLELLLD